MSQIEELSNLGLRGFQQESPGEGGDKKGDEKGGDSKDKASDQEDASDQSKSVEFITADEIDKGALESADSLNVLLNKVANAAALAGEQRGYERAVKDTPALVSKLTESQITARDAARDFLTANPDLEPVRGFVGMVANELQAKNPDWDLKTLYTKAGEEARKRLLLSKDAAKINEDKGAEENASLPKRGAGGGGSTRRSDESGLTNLQKDISAAVKHAEG